MRYIFQDQDSKRAFEITGTSFLGRPKDGTVLFVTKQMENLLERLSGHQGCLIFAEKDVRIPAEITEGNSLRICEDAQESYSLFIQERQKEREREQASRKYTLTPEGYYLGENVRIGEGARIEPYCLIDHDVQIGKDARIGFGSRISHAIIGDGFRCADYAVIGTEAYYPTGNGENRFQLPSFGMTIIGNHVDIGAHTVIERGVMGDTVIRDNVMIDADCCVGHEDDLGRRARITCGVKLGGIVELGEEAYIGMNAVVKQRLSIGERATIGMGSVVAVNVRAGEKVFGNPARKMLI